MLINIFYWELCLVYVLMVVKVIISSAWKIIVSFDKILSTSRKLIDDVFLICKNVIKNTVIIFYRLHKQ